MMEKELKKLLPVYNWIGNKAIPLADFSNYLPPELSCVTN